MFSLKILVRHLQVTLTNFKRAEWKKKKTVRNRGIKCRTSLLGWQIIASFGCFSLYTYRSFVNYLVFFTSVKSIVVVMHVEIKSLFFCFRIDDSFVSDASFLHAKNMVLMLTAVNDTTHLMSWHMRIKNSVFVMPTVSSSSG